MILKITAARTDKAVKLSLIHILLNEPLYYYRMRQGSITYSLPAMNAAEMKKAYQEQRHEIAKFYPELISCTDMNLFKANFLILYTAARDKLMMIKPV